MNRILSVIICLLINFNIAQLVFISKGTLWCGKGNYAKICTDLGELKETDACCRKHDLCPYKYTSSYREHNGFKWSWRKIYTLTHCECDTMFKKCLEEEPIKNGSASIWHSYNILGIKCYSFFPCNQNDKNFISFWKSLGNRETGTCYDGLKVVVFNSIEDYKNVLHESLNRDELLVERNILNSSLDKFYVNKTKSKLLKYADCSDETKEYRDVIVSNFAQSFDLENKIQKIKVKESKILDEIYEKELLESNSRRKIFMAKAKDVFMKIFSLLT